MDHVEDGRMDRALEFHTGNPILHPADPALHRLDARKRNPDHVIAYDPDRQFDPAAFGREIEQVDTPSMLACAAKIDVSAERNTLPPAPMVFHGMLPAIPSCREPNCNSKISEGNSSVPDAAIDDWLEDMESLASRHVAL